MWIWKRNWKQKWERKKYPGVSRARPASRTKTAGLGSQDDRPARWRSTRAGRGFPGDWMRRCQGGASLVSSRMFISEIRLYRTSGESAGRECM